jgi:leucyl-tRNA synthetase
MSAYAEERGFGGKSVLFRLRDWGISRQRYWGTPIPIIYCEKCGIQPVPYEDLPVRLPFDVEFKGQEGSPLENSESFIQTECPRCKGPARRETDTMDTFFDSSWYYFRYCSPREENLPFDPGSAKYWLPVDLYVGGVEHAILHLIYARFFCKVLRDLGLTSLDEPFPHLLAQGMVLKDGAAMSKSKGNVVDPDEMISEYGADTLRIFILFASPPEKEFICFRFLNRIWAFFQSNRDLFKIKNDKANDSTEIKGEKALQLRRKMHQTIKKVTEDIARRYHLNTAISSIMEYFNQIKKESSRLLDSEEERPLIREAFKNLILLLAPFAPHICEEMWEGIGEHTMVSLASWPDFDPELAKEETVTIVVQVNGKLRDRFDAERDLPEEEAKKRALEIRRIQEFISGKQVKKVIYIKNKLVNIVV